MFGGLMGGFDDMFGSMQRMNNMMNSIFGNDPFMNNGVGQVPGIAGVGPPQRSQSMSMVPFGGHQDLFSQFAFPNMNQMMQSMSQISNNPNCHSFSSSSVMTMTTGPDGRPVVYQASESSRSGPGGIRETKKTVCDGRTGVKKMAIGHHIGERGHVREREQNMRTGQLEENDDYINLEEEQEPEFTREWQERTQHFRPHQVANPAISYHQPHHGRRNEYLALPPPSMVINDKTAVSPEEQAKKKHHRSKPYSKRKEKKTEKQNESNVQK